MKEFQSELVYLFSTTGSLDMCILNKNMIF